MRYALIALSLCILSQNAPVMANAGAVCDERELSNEAILDILLKNSKIRRASQQKKVVKYCLKLTKKRKPPLTGKEKTEIKDFLLPNRDDVRRCVSHDHVLRDRFRSVYKHCLADILRGHPNVGHSGIVAGDVADILIPY